MSYTVWTISLCYNDPDIIEESMRRLIETTSRDVNNNIVMVDQHWPIDRENTRDKLIRIADDVGATLLDPGKNLGLHGGFNWALFSQAIPDNAMVIGYDPDSYPDTPGWDKAMCDLFVADEKIVWMSLWHPHATRELITEKKSKPFERISGHRIREVSAPVINSVCGFRMGFLRATVGLTEPSKFYGGLECAMWESVKKHGRWVFLEDYVERLWFHDRVNPDYRDWKWEHAHRGYPYDFSHYLSERGKL
jgi:hypothetical protein